MNTELNVAMNEWCLDSQGTVRHEDRARAGESPHVMVNPQEYKGRTITSCTGRIDTEWPVKYCYSSSSFSSLTRGLTSHRLFRPQSHHSSLATDLQHRRFSCWDSPHDQMIQVRTIGDAAGTAV